MPSDVLDTPDSAYDIVTSGSGPKGALPLTDQLLRHAPSGDLFGWTQNVGMGWNPALLGGKEFTILSTHGGLRAEDGTPDGPASWPSNGHRPAVVARARAGTAAAARRCFARRARGAAAAGSLGGSLTDSSQLTDGSQLTRISASTAADRLAEKNFHISVVARGPRESLYEPLGEPPDQA